MKYLFILLFLIGCVPDDVVVYDCSSVAEKVAEDTLACAAGVKVRYSSDYRDIVRACASNMRKIHCTPMMGNTR